MNSEIIQAMCNGEIRLIWKQILVEMEAVNQSVASKGADRDLTDVFISKSLEQTDRIQFIINDYRLRYGADVIPLDWNFDE